MKKILAPLAFALLAAPAAAQNIAIPVYGNWCGPNHGGGPAIDGIDAACMRHDYCTAQRGFYDCGCDLAMMSELRNQPYPNPWMADRARGLYEVIAVKPCDTPGGMSEKLEMAASDWINDVMTGREAPWSFLQRFGDIASEGLNRAY